MKCMNEINFKIVMLDENHMYIDESHKMDEWSINELLDDNWK